MGIAIAGRMEVLLGEGGDRCKNVCRCMKNMMIGCLSGCGLLWRNGDLQTYNGQGNLVWESL